MQSPARWATALLGLALVALAGWWLLRDQDSGGPDGPREARKERADTPGADLSADAPTLKGSAPAGPRAAKPRFTLTVRLPDLSPDEVARTKLWLLAVDYQRTEQPPTPLAADPSGTTVVDVRDLALRPNVRMLHVTADSPDHLRGSEGVDLPKPEARAKGLDLSVEIRLRHAAVLVGRIVDAEGRPVRQAIVAADHPGGGRDPETRVSSHAVRSDADGRFRVRVEPGPEVVALVWASGMAPVASSSVRSQAGATHDVGTLRLVPEAKWEGRVEGAAAFPGQTHVRAIRLGRLQPSEIPNLMWHGDQPVPASAFATVANDETFALAPVVPGWWRVRVELPDAKEASTPDLLRSTERIAHTRDGFLLLDVSRARLHFQVTHAGQPFDGATVVVTGGEAVALQTLSGGVARVVVRPSTTYEVVAFSGGLVSRTVSYTSPPAGQEATLTLPLEATKKKGVPADLAWAEERAAGTRLALEVFGPDGHPAPARARLRDANGTWVPTAWVERGMIVCWRSADRLLGRTWASLVSDVPAGTYTLRVELEGCQPAEQTVHIGDKSDSVVKVQLQPE